MKSSIFPVVFSVLALTSCGNARTPDKPRPEPPKALQDKSETVDFLSKRGYEDLVESLYKDATEKSPQLKELEKKVKDVGDSEADSTATFNGYNEKNQSYYSTANRYIEQIKDSVLRGRIKTVIAASLEKYNAKISTQKELLRLINKNKSTLGDLHTALKIAVTLPVIEQYQGDYLPAARSMDGYCKQLAGTVKYADTLVKKNAIN